MKPTDMTIAAKMRALRQQPQPEPTIEHLQRYIDALRMFLDDANEEIARLKAKYE